MTYLHNIKTETCYICHIIINFKKEYIGQLILVQTELTQLKIVRKTNRLYHETGGIIMPLDLDKNMKMVDVNVYKYLIGDYHDPSYRVVMTDKILPFLMENTKNIFGGSIEKAIKKEPYNITYFNIPKIEINLTDSNKKSELDDIYDNIMKKHEFMKKIEFMKKLIK